VSAACRGKKIFLYKKTLARWLAAIIIYKVYNARGGGRAVVASAAMNAKEKNAGEKLNGNKKREERSATAALPFHPPRSCHV